VIGILLVLLLGKIAIELIEKGKTGKGTIQPILKSDYL